MNIEERMERIENAILALAAVMVKPDPKPAKTLEVIPWVELMWPEAVHTDNGVKNADSVQLGLRTWSEVASRAIVTTFRFDPDEAVLSWQEALSKEEMTIIPGLKPYAPGTHRILIGTLDDIDGWGKVADEVKRMAEYGGPVLLDIEELSKPYVNGGILIARGDLEQGLRKLPGDVEMWWWPSVWGSNEERRMRSSAIASMVQAALGDNVRFVDQRAQGPDLPERFGIAGEMLDGFARNDTLGQAMFYGGDIPTPHWRDDQIVPCLHIWGNFDGELLIYPGLRRFESSARTLVDGVREWRNG